MRLLSTAVLALLAWTAPASAAPFVFEYTGFLRSTDQLTAAGGGANLVGADRSFQFVASFDTASPNLVGFLPFPGFVAYAPTAATIRVGGTTYDVASYSASTPAGVAVALFDPRQPIFPGLYGVGFIANPAADGAGIIGDFSGASPAVLTNALASATFTGFNGAGYSQGPGCGPGATVPCVPTAIPLSAYGQAYALLFGPTSDVEGGTATALLTAVPEPGSAALVLAGVLGLAGLARRTRSGS